MSFRLVRRFQDHRQAGKRRVMRDAPHGLQPDKPFADARVPVLMTAKVEQAVVEMQRSEPF